MTKAREKKASSGGFASLKLTLLVSLIIGLGVALVVFLFVSISGRAAINKYYLSDSQKTERAEAYASALQTYVNENNLTSEDTKKLAEWAKSNRYLYVLIYKDDMLLFDSGAYEEESGKGDGTGSGSGADGTQQGSGTESGKEESIYPGTGGLTVQVPTREDLIKYAEEQGSHLITMGDANLLVSMADFSEYFYYDMANIIAIVLAMFSLIAVVMLFFFIVTGRITKLGKDVKVVANGDIDHVLYKGGRDEIGMLAHDVEQMRRSLVESIAKERETMDANNQLITSMSHDIRTPLTVLLGYLDVMKSYTSDEVMKDYIRASEKTATRLKGLSDDMFNYFLMFGSEAGAPEMKEYDALMLFDQLVSEHVLLLEEKGYKVSLDLCGAEGDAPMLLTDPSSLSRIVENVFSNIYKYADKARPVSISTRIEGAKIQLLFTNYIDKSGEKVESNGIGLKTCRKLSELLGAEFLSYEDEESFSVTITLALIEEVNDDKL